MFYMDHDADGVRLQIPSCPCIAVGVQVTIPVGVKLESQLGYWVHDAVPLYLSWDEVAIPHAQPFSFIVLAYIVACV